MSTKPATAPRRVILRGFLSLQWGVLRPVVACMPCVLRTRCIRRPFRRRDKMAKWLVLSPSRLSSLIFRPVVSKLFRWFSSLFQRNYLRWVRLILTIQQRLPAAQSAHKPCDFCRAACSTRSCGRAQLFGNRACSRRTRSDRAAANSLSSANHFSARIAARSARDGATSSNGILLTPTVQPVRVTTPQPVQVSVPQPVSASQIPQVTAPQVTTPLHSVNDLLPSTVDMQTTGATCSSSTQVLPTVTLTITPTAPKILPQPGWSTDNASRVTLKSATVYNLSRRFGVPADVIYKVNGLENNSIVQAGQTLVIPIYQYDSAAPISAPDANPDTKLAKSTSGTVLTLPDQDAPQPVPRPFYQNGRITNNTTPVSKPVQTPNIVAPTPASSPQPVQPIVAAPSQPVQTNGVYRVASGDSLYAIARKHGI